MKKCAVFCLLLLVLSGCSAAPDEMEAGLQLRSRLLQASECTFSASITADYGDQLHTFSMDCRADKHGDLGFTVTAPDTISGIQGQLSGEGGKLTFADTALYFELLAEEQLSPVSAPWILVKTLRSGYITSACREEETIRLSVEDSFEEDSLRLDIWLNTGGMPEHADILYGGRRILSVDVENFQIL